MSNGKRQYYTYLGIIFFSNLVFIVTAIFLPLSTFNLIIIGLPQFRDTCFVLIRIVSLLFSRHDRRKHKDTPRTIISVIPAYKEDPSDVLNTINSLSMPQNMNDVVQSGMVIISDGFMDYHEILGHIVRVYTFTYETYKRETNTCDVFLGRTSGGVEVLVFKKKKNAGKKDSLILMDDVLILEHERENKFNIARQIVLEVFGIDHIDFIFHTDADTVLGDDCLERLSTIMLGNKKIAGVCGLVLVEKKKGFWNYFQAYQYSYGQIIRKATESVWGKVTCIPGCIGMVNVNHDAIVQACDRYNKLPSKDFIFQYKNRLQGTDRRYTNCVLQHSKDTYILLDMQSVSFTEPPQSFSHFRSQRKRWTSNAITGNFFLVFGKNIPFYTRMNCFVDIVRIHTSFTRFASTIQFFMNINDVEQQQVVMLFVVIALPYLFFLCSIVYLFKIDYVCFLLLGSFMSKIASPFITLYIFTYAMIYFNDLTWGKTHGTEKNEQEEHHEEPEQKNDDDTQCDTLVQREYLDETHRTDTDLSTIEYITAQTNDDTFFSTL